MKLEYKHALLAIFLPFINIVPLIVIITKSFSLPLPLYFSIPLLFIFITAQTFSTIYRRKGPHPSLLARIREAIFMVIIFAAINLLLSRELFNNDEISYFGHFLLSLFNVTCWILSFQIQSELAHRETENRESSSDSSKIFKGIKKCRATTWFFLGFNIIIFLVVNFYGNINTILVVVYLVQLYGNFFFFLVFQHFRQDLSFTINGLSLGTRVPLLTIVLLLLLLSLSLFIAFKTPVVKLTSFGQYLVNLIREIASRIFKPEDIQLENEVESVGLDESFQNITGNQIMPEETFFSLFLRHLGKGLVGLFILGLVILLVYPLFQRLTKSKYARRRERKLFFQQIKAFFTNLFRIDKGSSIKVSRDLPTKKDLQKFFKSLMKEKNKERVSLNRFISAFYEIIKWGTSLGATYSTNLSPLEYCKDLSRKAPEKSADIIQFGSLLERCLYSENELNNHEEKNLFALARKLPQKEVLT